MKSLVAGTALAIALISPALADYDHVSSYGKGVTLQTKALTQEIDEAAWSLKHSSMSTVLDVAVIDKSIAMLNKAREELATGHMRTAQDLVRRASLPLTQMSEAAMQGRHPDQHRQALETRETLSSLISAADKIAEEKGVTRDFVNAAKSEIQAADQLIANGNNEKALSLLRSAHLTVSQRLADLRSGDVFHIATPTGSSAKEWQDGLRRITERREISRYIEAEARWEGLDTRALERGTRAAEVLVDRASALAQKQRFAQALVHLDDAYALYEQSWRTVGVEW